MDELARSITSHIEDHGWHLTGVEETDRTPGWVYSVGLIERFDHPELIVMGGCCMQCGASALNRIGRLIQGGLRFRAGDHLPIEGAFGAVRFGPVHPGHWTTGRFGTWLNHYGASGLDLEPAALQVITRRQSGRWQDEESSRRQLRLDRPPLRHSRHPRSRPT